jgi:hypothetical protein
MVTPGIGLSPPASSPFDQPGIEGKLLLLAGLMAIVKQEFGAGQADAVAYLGRERVEQCGLVDIDEDLDRLAACGPRRLADEIGVRGVALLRDGNACFGSLQRRRAGLDGQRAGSRVENGRNVTLQPVQIGGKPDNQADTARPGEDRYMTGGAAAERRRATDALPVEPQETRGGQLRPYQDRSARDFGRTCAITLKNLQHAPLQVGQVSGASGQDIVAAAPVLGDLGIEHGGPCPVGRRSGFNGLGDWRKEFVVFEQSELEFQDLAGQLVLRGNQRLDLRLRGGRGSLQQAGLIRGRGEAAVHGRHLAQHMDAADHDPAGDADAPEKLSSRISH